MLNKELLDFCFDFFNVYYREWTYGDEERILAILESSKLMREFIHYMKKRVDADIAGENISQKFEDYSRPKMMMISSHDSSILAFEILFAKVFNNNNLDDYFRFPKFAYQMALEVSTDDSIDPRNKNYSDYTIKFYFNDELIFEKKVDEFIKYVELAIWSDEKVDKYCGFIDEEKENNNNNNSNNDIYFYLMIIFSILSGIFLIIIVVLSIKLIKANNNRVSIIKDDLFLKKSEATE